ncbi:MAG: hypothetical protein GF350_10340 [Chitinivibrionales bacterium]|nr:hypothetical protein [Chitinivibrionales bacterium]
MKRLSGGCAVAAFFLAAGLLLTGCGPSEKKLVEGENRVAALVEKGVPDSILSKAKVHIYQARTQNKLGNTTGAGNHYDSMITILEKAEEWYAKTMTELKPVVENKQKEYQEKKKNLTGMQLEVFEEHVAKIDSFTSKNWLLQAKWECDKLDTLMPGLLEDEKTAHKIKPRLIGTWKRTDREGNAIRRETYTYKKDGGFTGVEQKKGQSSQVLKEDWKFISYGTYDLKGDTVYMYVTREKCPRQKYWNYKKKNGKMVWELFEAPTYDSTYTDGKKDKFMTYEYLKKFYRK